MTADAVGKLKRLDMSRIVLLTAVFAAFQRIALIAAVVIAAMSFSARTLGAKEGPWCAFINTGTGSHYEDCQYYSIEQCRPNVLAGNRGFCNPNPRWVGPSPLAAKSRAHRRKVRYD
jgi:hypothetical protein